jgi:phosphopantothenoylcysteine decarboxylase / phosphopantothenate---cysteine ligase
MDLDMFVHPSTQRNISILKDYGNIILDPDVGELASGLKAKAGCRNPNIF